MVSVTARTRPAPCLVSASCVTCESCTAVPLCLTALPVVYLTLHRLVNGVALRSCVPALPLCALPWWCDVSSRHTRWFVLHLYHTCTAPCTAGAQYAQSAITHPDAATGMAPGARLAFMDLSRGRSSAVCV